MEDIIYNNDLVNSNHYPIWFCTASHYYLQESVKRRFMHQFLFILDGKGTLYYGDKSFELKKGCAFFLAEDCYAEYVNEGGLVSCFITAKGVAMDVLAQNFAPDGYVFFENINVEKYSQLIKQILDVYKNYNDQAKLSLLTYSFFIKILSRSKNEFPHWVDVVINHINQNFHRKITLEELALCAYISTSKLCHDFQKFLSMTVFEYITTVRLENAQNLLYTQSDITLKDVARRCGFCDSGYFCKAYKRKYGKTPKGQKGSFIQDVK